MPWLTRIAVLASLACQIGGAADDIWQSTCAAYASLHSYSDTGTVLKQYAQSEERHSFATRFRTPRQFYFDFHKDGGDRFVIFSDDNAFHTWWKSTAVQQDFAKGRGAMAFAQSDFLTAGAGLKIASLLFPQAGLRSPFPQFTDRVVEGTEDLDGHKCYRLTGVTKDIYPGTGREVNIHKMTVWVDSETLLIRKVFENAA